MFIQNNTIQRTSNTNSVDGKSHAKTSAMLDYEGVDLIWLWNKAASRLRFGRLLGCWTILICLGITACQAQPITTQPLVTATKAEATPPRPSKMPTLKPSPTLTPAASVTVTAMPTATNPASPTLTPSPTLIGPQVVWNSGFDQSVQHWEQPYGVLKHTTSDYHTGPGAARLITNSITGFLGYRGNAGQCIDLLSFLSEWPVFEGQLYMTLEAYLRTDQDITNVSLNGIFLDDPQCGTGQVGFFVFPSSAGNQLWTRVTGTRSIPAEAQSLHVFISANGTTESATVYIDDVRAYSAESPTK